MGEIELKAMELTRFMPPIIKILEYYIKEKDFRADKLLWFLVRELRHLDNLEIIDNKKKANVLDEILTPFFEIFKDYVIECPEKIQPSFKKCGRLFEIAEKYGWFDWRKMT
jgi:hypothetical protein